jgi:hypothetical protein
MTDKRRFGTHSQQGMVATSSLKTFLYSAAPHRWAHKGFGGPLAYSYIRIMEFHFNTILSGQRNNRELTKRQQSRWIAR